MDWLDGHIQEVILPNLRGEVLDATGIELDPSLGEFKVEATALDADEENSEEYEITIHFGDLCLVDACFLVEEIETGNLPLCHEPEELTEALVKAKTRYLREQVIPVVREEFADELGQHGWDAMLAHQLEITPETLSAASEMRSSGGYPPMALTFRHPEFDPDMFEVSVRIDPMTRREWVNWDKLMPRIDLALRAVGEEPTENVKNSKRRQEGDVDPVDGSIDSEEPSPDDLEDEELVELEGDAQDDSEPGGGTADTLDAVPSALLEQLQALLTGSGSASETDAGKAGKAPKKTKKGGKTADADEEKPRKADKPAKAARTAPEKVKKADKPTKAAAEKKADKPAKTASGKAKASKSPASSSKKSSKSSC